MPIYAQRRTHGNGRRLGPFADTMKRRAASDIDDSYNVMERIIRNHLPQSVAPACSDDISARDYAVRTFEAAMDDQRRKAARRLSRSADGIDPAEAGEICHNLTDIRDDVEKHVPGPRSRQPVNLRSPICAGARSRIRQTRRPIKPTARSSMRCIAARRSARIKAMAHAFRPHYRVVQRDGRCEGARLRTDAAGRGAHRRSAPPCVERRLQDSVRLHQWTERAESQAAD